MTKAKQTRSGTNKTVNAQQWASEVIAITDNAKQNGLEIRFDAEPSPQLQPKLRAMNFRHSRMKTMWYGDNTQQALDFAEQVKKALPNNQAGPDLWLQPSAEAVRTNIEKKEFSFVMITLKDGQSQNYVVFEPSKPKAEVIAMNFANEQFPDNFIALAALPKTHIKEARTLFDEGKIIYPNGKKMPVHRESVIKTKTTQQPEMESKDEFDTPANRQRDLEVKALDKYYKWAVQQDDENVKPTKIKQEDLASWLKESQPSLDDKAIERIWQSHQRILKSLSRVAKISSTKATQQPYSSIYKKLLKVIPNLPEHIKAGIMHGKSKKDPEGGLMDLNYDFLSHDKHGNPIFALSHYYKQGGDMIADPDMQIRLMPDMEMAEALTFQDHFGFQQVYPEKDGKIYVNLKLKKSLNQFLNQWLTNIIHQGHRIDLVQEKDEESDPDYNRKAWELINQLIPTLQKHRKEDRELEITISTEDKAHVITANATPRSNKTSSVFLHDVIGNEPQMETEVVVDFASDTVSVASEWLSSPYAFKFQREESEDELEERKADVEQEMARALCEWVEDLFSKHPGLVLNPKEPDGISNESPATKSLSIATDLKVHDRHVPNVLVPAATQEPFYSQSWSLYDMKAVLKNNFPHLLEINSKNLSKASPIAMFELMQFAHPTDYGIKVSRMDMLSEWEKRGRTIFREIGFPTDDLYPYVNLYLGYESVEPLKEMLFDNNKNGDEWWAIAEHARPVADVKKGIKIINDRIAKEKREMKIYLNPATGKPKVEYKQQVKDVEFTIRYLEESKEVLQHYLDHEPETKIEEEEEIASDPLANENGVFTRKTAGNNFEEIEIPIPKSAQYEATVIIVKTSAGQYTFGLSAEKQFGDHNGMGFAASTAGQVYASREEALEVALKQHETRLELLLTAKDSILNNEAKKNKQLNTALDALRKFAEENNIVLDENSVSTDKITVKEIHLSTNNDFANSTIVYSWKEADNYAHSKIGKYSDVFFKVIWKDGENIERSISIKPVEVLKDRENLLSGLLSLYYDSMSKMKLLEGSSLQQKDIEFAKKLIGYYSFSDTANQSGSFENKNFIKGLEAAYWNKEDNEYPVNKITIKGMKFNQARLREAIGAKLEKLPIPTLEQIVSELSEKFEERRSLAQYEKGLVTIGKKGDKRRAILIAAYVDDMIIDNDLSNKRKPPVMTFLLELLFSASPRMADLPQHIETPEPTPKPMKKQSQYDLNKEIEAFIDEKDKTGSDYYGDEERNYLRQYTGSGGLLKQGAADRGALYEYYTPDEVVKKMWDIAYHFGYNGGKVCEPSVGTGNFLKYAPKNATVIGFETNHYSARIAQILFPQAHIYEKAFETLFFAGNVHLKDKFENPGYSLVIGNPPYGEFTGKYAGMGEKQHTSATEYDQYFIVRGLDVLEPGGLLVLLIPSAFMTNGSKYQKVKEKIAAKAELLDCYRLPGRIFETTDIGTDILVLKRK